MLDMRKFSNNFNNNSQKTFMPDKKHQFQQSFQQIIIL